MKLIFYGGAKMVTGANYLLEAQTDADFAQTYAENQSGPRKSASVCASSR